MAHFEGVSSRVSHGVSFRGSQIKDGSALPTLPKRRGSKPVRLSLGPIPQARACTRGGTAYDYRSPVAGIKLAYPNTAPLPKKSAPLSFEKINTLFRTGCESGHLDNAMLPLLGSTTGRRLAVLVNLHGSDFEEKFPGVWLAQLGNIKYVDGHWRTNVQPM